LPRRAIREFLRPSLLLSPDGDPVHLRFQSMWRIKQEDSRFLILIIVHREDPDDLYLFESLERTSPVAGGRRMV
jgi:hypothetical protein